MKIITNDCAYVQNSDIAELMNALIVTQTECPKSVFETSFSCPFTCNEENQYEFIEFHDKDAIEFFKNANYIIDYSDVKDAKKEVLQNYLNKLETDKNKMIQLYNQMSKEKQSEYHSSINLRTRLIDHKIKTLKEFELFKNGKLRMELPEGIEYPKGCKYGKKLQRILRSFIYVK